MVGAVALTAALTLLLGCTPARAEPKDTWHSVLKDKVGDAPKRADITSLSSGGNDTRTRHTLTVRDVRRSGVAVFDLSFPRERELRFTVTKRTGKAPTVKGVKRTVSYEDGTSGPWRPFGCTVRAVWSASSNYVRITIPNRCLDGEGPWRATYTSTGARDRLVV